MPTSGRRPRRLAVQMDPTVWDEEVERFAAGSSARAAAQRERRSLEHEGVVLTSLLPCEAAGSGGTRLEGLVKVYLELVAFGERHPATSTTRSVYERAHKRLHGRYPDE